MSGCCETPLEFGAPPLPLELGAPAFPLVLCVFEVPVTPPAEDGGILDFSDEDQAVLLPIASGGM